MTVYDQICLHYNENSLMETGCAVILARMFQAFKKSVLNEYMDQGPNTHLYGKLLNSKGYFV